MSINNKRRNFLKMCTSGTCGALIHRTLAPVNQMFAYAAVPGSATVDTSKVLVVVNLAGGASYNSAPIYNSAYRVKNPNVSFGEEAPTTQNNNFNGSHMLNSEQGLHPALAGFKAIYDEGNLALLNLVGYPDPNRSHDESANIWFRGDRSGATSAGMSGWGARMTCQMGSAYAGMSLAGSNPLIIGGCNPPRAYGNIANLGDTYFQESSSTGYWSTISRTEVQYLLDSAAGTANSKRNLVTSNVTSAEGAIKTLKAETAAALPVSFPNSGFGQQCMQAAKLIQARSLNVQFIFLETGGYDTHADERVRLGQNLMDVNAGLTALVNALKHSSINRWNDTTIITMSEFCRTFENGSEGTDHGHAGPMFIMGGQVKGGIKSQTPTTAHVNAADGYFHNYDVDFREPFYYAVARMGLDPSIVFPGSFSLKNLDLFY